MDTTTDTGAKTGKKTARIHVPAEPGLINDVEAEIALANDAGAELDVSKLTRMLLRRWVSEQRAKRPPQP